MDQIEQLLTCPVCLDRFNEPKILPCQHTFCLRPCLQNIVQDRSIRCPECRSFHLLPRNGINGLPPNLTIVRFLDLPSYQSSQRDSQCKECGKNNCETEKCNHCDKALCKSCLLKHTRNLQLELKQTVCQIKRIVPKVSELVSELEKRQKKSKESGKSIKHEIAQSIDRCITELQSRRRFLFEEVDAFVTVETRLLQSEQENLELDLATLTSHCEIADEKCNRPLDGSNEMVPSSTRRLQSEIVQLTRQGREHIRNNKLISTNVEDKMGRSIKFGKDGERSVLSAISDFGGVSLQVPSKLSLTFGSDLFINDEEVQRAINADHSPRYGRRAVSESQQLHPDVFVGTPPLDSSWDETLSVQHHQETQPVPRDTIMAVGHVAPRPRGGNRRRQNRSGPRETSAYLSIGNDRPPASTIRNDRDFNSHVTGVRTTLWQYRSKGQVKKYFGMKGSDIGCMNWPRGIAVTPDSHVIVADSSNHRIQIYDTDGSPFHVFGSYGSGNGQFDCIAGVCVTSQGHIVTSDRYNHRIQIYDCEGRFVTKFGEEGSGEGQLSYPWGVASDNAGLIYICDKDNHRIQIFTREGVFVRKFGSVGTRETHFDGPQYVTVATDNKVVVGDCGNHRVQVFDKIGRFLFKFGSEGTNEAQFRYPRGVATDRHGNIIIGDSGNNRVQIFRSDGSFISSFGSWGSEPGQMKGLEGVCLLANNDIVISDRENHRIQIF